MSIDNLGPVRQIIVGFQMLFVAFGALVLVPILTGLDPNVALFTAGVGTLIFHLITGRQVPIFLASSFAFIAPIIYGVQTWGIPATLSGLCAAGLVYMLLSAVVAIKGRGIIARVLPPVVIGPVIMVIGLSRRRRRTGGRRQGADRLDVCAAGDSADRHAGPRHAAAAADPDRGGGRLRAQHVLRPGRHRADRRRAAVRGAFVMPEFNWQAILFIVPVAIAPAIEHIGDMLAIGGVTGRKYVEKPGLHRTLLGDGVATSFASLVGGPPNTTYSEVTGAVALTRAFNPNVMIIAAVFAIVISFSGKLGAFLGTIPTPVMGGILILLFGAIAAIGMNTLVKDGRDLGQPRNLIIVSVALVFGIGGMSLGTASFSMQGIGLSAITAIVLNLLLPRERDQ